MSEDDIKNLINQLVDSDIKINELQQENQQLKEEKISYDDLINSRLGYVILTTLEKENIRLSEQVYLYKSVLDEIREYIKEREPRVRIYGQATFNIDDLLQILDKVKENERGTTKAS